MGAIASGVSVLVALFFSYSAFRFGRTEARERRISEQTQRERAQADQIAAWVEVASVKASGRRRYIAHVSNASALPISTITVMISTGPAVEQAGMVRMHSVGPGADQAELWWEVHPEVAPREIPPIQTLTFTDARGWRWEKTGDSLMRHYIDAHGDAATKTY